MGVAGIAGYNEYKFRVTQDVLPRVKLVLSELHGRTDPFPEGFVDSIYFDTLDRRSFYECFDGNVEKMKLRIRGYGDGFFNQVHLKQKDMYGVSKLKSKITPIQGTARTYPHWSNLIPVTRNDNVFSKIAAIADMRGHLIPAIRVRYYRYRFRINDYRVTLDTNVEVMGFDNGRDKALDYSIIPFHVLEVKTSEARPHLPLLGIVSLPQISYSKFFLGLQLLANGKIEQ